MKRLVGPDGATLKALELLTQCYILVQGNTVAAMGPVRGIKQARQVILDCMKNIHPVYNIKRLMIQRELAKDPKLKDEDWNRFLPTFSKKNVPRRKPQQELKEKEKSIKASSQKAEDSETAGKSNKPSASARKQKKYTPFPPPQTPSKIDLQLESGEYFISERARKAKILAEKKQRSLLKSQERKQAREAQYDAPEDSSSKRINGKKRKDTNDEAEQHKIGRSIDVESLKSKFSASAKKRNKSSSEDQMSDFVQGLTKRN